jgi:hypothetical protein
VLDRLTRGIDAVVFALVGFVEDGFGLGQWVVAPRLFLFR